VSVVPFRHPRVAVTQLGRDHAHRHAAHRQPRGIGVAQFVKGDGWTDIGRGACRTYRPELVGIGPGSPDYLSWSVSGCLLYDLVPYKKPGRAGLASCDALKEFPTFVRECDVTRLAASAGW
jgi:hypothetical protein